MGEWRRRRAARRIKPGTGRKLQPFRWWQPFARSLYSIDLGRQVYAVDVRHRRRFFSEDGKGTADLYLDGRHHAESKLPAAFSVPGGTIEVADSPFGLKRCHYITDEGKNAGWSLIAPRPKGGGSTSPAAIPWRAESSVPHRPRCW